MPDSDNTSQASADFASRMLMTFVLVSPLKKKQKPAGEK